MSDSTVRADLCDRGECARLRARVEELEAQLATARDDTGWAEELETLANDLPADCYPEEAGVLLGAADRLRMVAAENARTRMLTLLRVLTLFLLALVVCSCSTRPAPKPSLSPSTPVVVPVAPRGPSQADIDRMRRNQKEIAASQERNRLASDAARRDAEQRTKAYHQQREEEAQRKAATDRALEQLHMDRITRTVTVVVEASLLNPAGATWGPASLALVESPHGSQLYHISGWVDSTNEFGATFRLNYLGAVRTRIVPDEYGRPTHEYTLESFVSYE